ncbi:MAG: prepilin-type N-terminal cleavage/methylation domain-containing protein, partial [Gammaproteobacteria bacterium]|nr:prepilin-type N-terminal cleavage/methylation domain-containing protein [Gammaproteobacteria bacterium]
MNSILPTRFRSRPLFSHDGFTYVELMITLAIASLIIVGLGGVVGQALQSQDAVSESNRLTRDARFAMQRMLRSVTNSRRLLLPLRDNPSSNWPENIREQ